MTNLSVTAKTNVENNIRIDYITILTTEGKEINLNWRNSDYYHEGEKLSTSQSMRKFAAHYGEILFDDEEENEKISDFDKLNVIQDAKILEMQLYVENFKGNPKTIKFDVKKVEFTFEFEDQNGCVFSYSLPVKYDENFTLIIEKQ